MKNRLINTLIPVFIFAVAMGYLESAVVVYIRHIYYPEGFDFPLRPLDKQIIITEVFREVATLFMLMAIGFIASRKPLQRFAWFIFSFAVWDIFYYVFLRLLIGWPQSLLTWDVLFFIPVTWIGPVIAPIINSLMMILLSLVILHYARINAAVKTGLWVWLLLISGSVVVMIAYMMDYTAFIASGFSLSEMLNTGNNQEVMELASHYIPRSFNWFLFSTGALMHLAGIIIVILKNGKQVLKIRSVSIQ